MAITLNLKHTFSTRAVWTSKEIAELRECLVEARLASLKVLEDEDLSAKLSSKRIAQLRVAVDRVEALLPLSDEDLVLAIMKDALKNYFREEVAKELKRKVHVTDVSPVQTAQVKR